MRNLLDVLTSLLVSHTILPRDVCFATSRPANHAICSYIYSSEYAPGPIRLCLFIYYIIDCFEIYRHIRLFQVFCVENETCKPQYWKLFFE